MGTTRAIIASTSVFYISKLNIFI